MDHKGSQILIDLELWAEVELEAVAKVEAVPADEIFVEQEEDFVKVSAFQFHSVSQD